MFYPIRIPPRALLGFDRLNIFLRSRGSVVSQFKHIVHNQRTVLRGTQRFSVLCFFALLYFLNATIQSVLSFTSSYLLIVYVRFGCPFVWESDVFGGVSMQSPRVECQPFWQRTRNFAAHNPQKRYTPHNYTPVKHQNKKWVRRSKTATRKGLKAVHVQNDHE